MNRKLLIVMLLTAVVAAEGCRRGSDKTKAPIGVEKESDFLYTRKSDVIGAGLEPKKKAAKLTPEEEKLAQAAEALANKLKEEEDKKKRRENTVEMGNFLLTYRNTNPVTLYSFERIRTTLRRKNLIDLYDDMDQNKIEVVYLADVSDPKHIICYYKTTEAQGHPAMFGGDAAKIGLLRAETVPFVLPQELSGRIREQEMQVCWYYYMKFAIPHFYRAGADFDAFKEAMKRQDPFWLPEPPPASLPTVFLEKLQQRKPDLLKNPPEPRSFDRFKDYLAKNAPPHLLKLVVDNKVCFSLTADLRSDALLACRVDVDSSKESVKTNQAITINRQVGPYPADAMKKWITENQGPKN